MAYRRHRNDRPMWPFLIVLVLGTAAYLFRHSLEGELVRFAQRGKALVPASLQPSAPNTLFPFATPTFTVAIDRPVPLGDVPPPEVSASAYLAAWSTAQYAAMYAMLSRETQAMQTQDQFVQRYKDLTQEASITGITTRVTSIPIVPAGAGNGASVQVPFTVDFNTIRVGTFSEINSVPLVLEGGTWHVDWRPSLFFKDLAEDGYVHLFPLDPRRGSILDRQGRPLATMGFRVTIGVVPRELTADGHEVQTLTMIGQYLHKSPDDLKKVYASQPPDWLIPLGDVDGSLENELHQKLAALSGVYLQRKPIRVYPERDVAAHVVGYVGHITSDELKTLASQGYTIDDIVGRSGVEASAESALAGKRGGKLAVVAASGEVIKVIAERDAVPGDDVVLTLDLDVQKQAEKVLGTLDGSVVVMNPKDNSVLALASYPRFDPNKFVTGWDPKDWQAYNASPDSPFQNRPVEGQFPTGSVFKVITLSAGMEVAGFRITDTFDCNYWWHGLPGVLMHNWTVQGTLNLIQSVTGSCDPTFYTIGLALNRKDPFALPRYARAYGLGSKTGINGLNEVAGTVPDPAWKEQVLKQPWYAGDGVNLAIGQGYLQATPLQVANVYSTIANEGVRRTPLLIQKYVDQQGKVDQAFEAQTVTHVPVSPTTLKAIHDGMLGTTSTPLGTAYYAFSSYRHPMEAKTGSAENQAVLAHAWFVGYAPPTNPTLLILIMIEGRGESAQIASPIARQLMDALLPDDPAVTPKPRTTAVTKPTPAPKAATPTAVVQKPSLTPSPTPHH